MYFHDQKQKYSQQEEKRFEYYQKNVSELNFKY